MWLVSDCTPADLDDPQPGTVIAGRIEADHLGERFKFGALLVMQILRSADPVSTASKFWTMAATLPSCGCRASHPLSGLTIDSQALVDHTAAPSPGTHGICERQSRFIDTASKA